jgi:transcriptional regulator with XRE-family HTH domain
MTHMLAVEDVRAKRADLPDLCEVDQEKGDIAETKNNGEGGVSETISYDENHLTTPWGGQMKDSRTIEQTPLSVFVRERLAELGMKQSEFCRLTGFDQGLLSKIQSSMITNLSLETALRLAVGLAIPPQKIFTLIGRSDLYTLIRRAYSLMRADASSVGIDEASAPVREVNQLAQRVHGLGRSLEPVISVLSHLAISRGEKPRARLAEEQHAAKTR